MGGRPHKERLLFELNSIRQELSTEAKKLKPEELDWAPGPEMKSFKALLREIGTMEKICLDWIIDRRQLGWEAAEKELCDDSEDAPGILHALEGVREKTLRYLNACSEETLQTPRPLPKEWEGYFDNATIELEEILRWVARHEYYHLGQIIIYLWIRGDNPYKQPSSAA